MQIDLARRKTLGLIGSILIVIISSTAFYWMVYKKRDIVSKKAENTNMVTPKKSVSRKETLIQTEKKILMARVELAEQKPLSSLEKEEILKDFGGGNGVNYRLTQEEQLKIMRALNGK